jgi:hypothetical protein
MRAGTSQADFNAKRRECASRKATVRKSRLAKPGGPGIIPPGAINRGPESMSEPKPFQQCPICGAEQPLSARKCSICGAVLPGDLTPLAPMPPVETTRRKKGERPRYDPAHGDDDLFVGDLSGRMWRLLLVGGVALALLLGVGLGMAISQMGGERDQGPTQGGDGNAQVEDIGTTAPTAPPTATSRSPQLPPTVTPTQESLLWATITSLPPTVTETPTPAPCYQTAQAGDTVWGMAIRCGHGDDMEAIVDLILEINGLTSATELQAGQTLEIPWPTPTPGVEPLPAPEATGEGEQGADRPEATPQVQYNEFGTPDALAAYANIEPTLRPGQAWHLVLAGETIVGIAYMYGTSVETLSQINPEIPFLQCDFGQTYGGPTCSVMLYEGQRVRVPVALPTVTPTFTPAGTLTLTPTLTPTFNAPYLLTPDDGARFNADQIVTLRWGGTGTLAGNHRYIVRVRDLDTGEDYTAAVTDTTYILPGGWQPDDRHRHTFEWTVAIGTVDEQFNVVSEDHRTDPRRFAWESR